MALKAAHIGPAPCGAFTGVFTECLKVVNREKKEEEKQKESGSNQQSSEERRGGMGCSHSKVRNTDTHPGREHQSPGTARFVSGGGRSSAGGRWLLLGLETCRE